MKIITAVMIVAGVQLLTLGQEIPMLDLLPKPKECFYKGLHYDNEETFKDNCNTCRCINGEVACTKILCQPCPYIGPDGTTMLAQNTYNDGCNTCGCNNGISFCTLMYCGDKCHVTNNKGHWGWVDEGTVIIKDAEEEGGEPQECTCKSSVPEDAGYLDSLELVCE
jgi:hypothetical protein